MQPPTLTFACELDVARLTALFDDSAVLADLQALRARVVLMLSDYHPERARVAAMLNGAGIPVVGVPLVPADQGYYFTPDNVPQARASYARFTEWTKQHGLMWDGVGLDIEPDAAIFRQLNKDQPRVHHDALEFPDGQTVLLTDLLEGQQATVLQLPAKPATAVEEKAQERVAYIG